ncbi:signal recognition particle subunit SRP68 [Lachancea thermotolerans CBS 6340]|uniref:Signal recognition particle subunit SRP68 n=1 Tax=Lachancea thermotolerans (strain ATCC 56472 / CBS 6340 / NRRL Y-8284) TaxID=559295 RepID=C5E283_LACTC|nr:KLTH0H02882p [Lachancea thermotolerans CBS 6340]CAR30144.1 KLTH0H02882p [Lachancea thermotolerans CBS 6340]
MSYYSPLGATFGVRIDRFLETAEDFDKYHQKLNRKLQKLRHHCRLTTKDTKRYSTKEKYSKITSDDYDKNKLFGTLMLLHAERDLALVESLKLKARLRGAMKKSEKKVVMTRLRKACKTSEQLTVLTQNEGDDFTRAEYAIYHKLCIVSYFSMCKPSKTRYTNKIAKELSLAIASLHYLQSKEKVSDEVASSIISQFEYLLRQHADAEVFTTSEVRNFIAKQVRQSSDDVLVQLITRSGYEAPIEDSVMGSEKSNLKEVQWRRFSAKVRDSKVAELISEATQIEPTDLAQFSNKLAKWQEAADAHSVFIAQKERDDEDEDVGEDDQILLTYIKYNSHFTTIQRDDIVFQKLWAQWSKSANKSKNLKLTKFKEIERIVHNLATYLQEVMDLPGVYSDDALMANLKLATTYYQLHLTAGCLASFYQSKQKYLEALALYIDGHKTLEVAAGEAVLQEPLPGNILTPEKVAALEDFIKVSWRGVISLAEYEKIASPGGKPSLEPSLIEKLGNPIVPRDVSLTNLFPTRPIVRPVGSKPTLFDLAFNYIGSDSQTPQNEPLIPEESRSVPKSNDAQEAPKKKGLFGLFGL